MAGAMKKSRMLNAIVMPDGRRFPIKPFTPKQFRKTFAPYGAAIGYIAFSWNRLHDNLSVLFNCIVSSPSPGLGQAVWFSLDSDFSQRLMLKAALKLAVQLSNEQRDDVSWVMTQIDDSLRHKRNDALHAPLIVVRGIRDDALASWIEANINSKSPRAKALLNKDLMDEFTEYGVFADGLATYVGAMANYLRDPARNAWPKKPKLPHAHRTGHRKR